jgi:hypothetical protein
VRPDTQSIINAHFHIFASEETMPGHAGFVPLNPDGAAQPMWVSWKLAKEAGLRKVATLDARIERHKDGSVFFVQRHVRYDDGRCGWVRKRGESADGKPYTDKYASEDLAGQAVQSIKHDLLLDEAEAILKKNDAETADVPRYVMQSIYGGMSVEERRNLTAARLAELARERRRICNAVASELCEKGGSASIYLLERAFDTGARSYDALMASEHARLVLRQVEIEMARAIDGCVESNVMLPDLVLGVLV